MSKTDMNFVYNEAKPRIPKQREQILHMLREAGAKGVKNTTLQKVAIRWQSSIHELYRMGYKISCDTYLGDGVYVYILLEEPKEVNTTKPEKAKTVLLNKINDTYNGVITTQQLEDLLDAESLDVKRKANFYK